jgi:Phytanoyl-CoA dioxygenase (PhyH)
MNPPEDPSAVLPSGLAAVFQHQGVVIVEYALNAADLTFMESTFPALNEAAGARALQFSPAVLVWLAEHAGLAELAARLGGQRMEMARALALDKTPLTNWFVPWHQDRSADGRERPQAQLEQIVTLRVHLDDCGDENGPLEVIAGSHRQGRLDRAAIAPVVAASVPLLCLAVRGDIVALSPLLVHRSQRARKPARRRVLHLEYEPVLRHADERLLQ